MVGLVCRVYHKHFLVSIYIVLFILIQQLPRESVVDWTLYLNLGLILAHTKQGGTLLRLWFGAHDRREGGGHTKKRTRRENVVCV